MIKDLLLIN